MMNLLKSSTPYILVSLIIAPVTLMLFSWLGTSYLGTRDASIELPYIKKQVDAIVSTQTTTNSKIDSMLTLIYSNQTDVRVLSSQIRLCKDSLIECKKSQ